MKSKIQLEIPSTEVIQQVEPSLRLLTKEAADNIRLLVTQALSTATPPKPNTTKEERTAIKQLRTNTSIHILQADKGNATVIMDKTNYDNKIQELLNTGTYAKLRKDPTQTIERRLNQKLLALHKKDSILQTTFIISHLPNPVRTTHDPQAHNTTPANRLHKRFTHLQHCTTSSYYTTTTSRSVMSSRHHVINSRHFIEKINNINIGPTDLLVSFDVESLFTNVPVTEACDIIKTRLQQDTTLDTRTALSPEEIHDLLLTCLNETSFQWRDGYYKQLQGAAMGSPLSPIVANIFMEEFETSALQQATHQPKLWLRYVDDTFIIWQHSKQQLDNFFQHLNNQHSNIKFTMDTEAQG